MDTNESFKRVSFDEFRKELAFPMGDNGISEKDTDDAFNYLVGLCSILPRFYGEELDRANLWGRIDGGLAVAASRCSRSDEICDCMLSHICADVVRVAASDEIKDFFDPSVKLAAVKSVISTRRLLVIYKSRAIWTEGK